MVTFWMSTDIRDVAYDNVLGHIYANITDADFVPLLPYYEFLVGDDAQLKGAVESTACAADDEESFLSAIMECCPPPLIPVEPFRKVLHEAAANVVQRMWPNVQHFLEPLNESERDNLAVEMVRRLREELVMRMNEHLSC